MLQQQHQSSTVQKYRIPPILPLNPPYLFPLLANQERASAHEPSQEDIPEEPENPMDLDPVNSAPWEQVVVASKRHASDPEILALKRIKLNQTKGLYEALAALNSTTQKLKRIEPEIDCDAVV